ncbi:MAG: nucleotide sugar dehydrogenase, partial [Candidatus Marinimicrobia bacterium]|nr:nucleotide sugar dehydrogenase [Candidatus Neomarinimicrobiota bacterium]
MHDVLIRKIDSREFVVGVIGLGYVGLPLAIHFAENGFYAHGFDIDPHKIQSLNQGDSYIRHIDSHSVRSNIRSGRFTAYSDFDRLVECDAIIITVPTPLSMNQEPDLSFIESTARSISNHLREEQIVILESTTYPGTTEDV